MISRIKRLFKILYTFNNIYSSAKVMQKVVDGSFTHHKEAYVIAFCNCKFGVSIGTFCTHKNHLVIKLMMVLYVKLFIVSIPLCLTIFRSNLYNCYFEQELLSMFSHFPCNFFCLKSIPIFLKKIANIANLEDLGKISDCCSIY